MNMNALLSNQLQSSLLGGSSPNALSAGLSTQSGGNFQNVLANSGGAGGKTLGQTFDSVKSEFQSFMNEGRFLEKNLGKATMGNAGIEEVIQDVAEYAVKLEAFKNIIDAAISASKKLTMEMQL
jgi:hypothetical protein